MTRGSACSVTLVSGPACSVTLASGPGCSVTLVLALGVVSWRAACARASLDASISIPVSLHASLHVCAYVCLGAFLHVSTGAVHDADGGDPIRGRE